MLERELQILRGKEKGAGAWTAPDSGAWQTPDAGDAEVKFRMSPGVSNLTSGYASMECDFKDGLKRKHALEKVPMETPARGPSPFQFQGAMSWAPQKQSSVIRGNAMEGKEVEDASVASPPIAPWPLKRDKCINGREALDARLEGGGPSRRPNITPDRFDGKTLWKDYREHIEACRLANNWTAEQAVVFLAASLQGPALKVTSGIGNGARKSNRIRVVGTDFAL